MPVRLYTAPLILLGVLTAATAADPGDAAAGKTFFSQTCMQCHTADPAEGGGEIGPSLIGLLGRTAGVGDSRFVYSPALKDSKLVWNPDTLDHFLTDPARAVPGTTMPIPVPAKKDRDNLLAYFQAVASSAK
ncbi:MAG: c-type cytochrome [Steroidobacteraceae bacterium]